MLLLRTPLPVAAVVVVTPGEVVEDDVDDNTDAVDAGLLMDAAAGVEPRTDCTAGTHRYTHYTQGHTGTHR
jgi:hypothetical protein